MRRVRSYALRVVLRLRKSPLAGMRYAREWPEDQVDQLFLVRHAETDWNAERRLQGHADKPLSVRGRRQAVVLGSYLRDMHFDAVFCSDLQRTAETTALAGFATARAASLWREFDVGLWSGRRIADIESRDGDAYSRWRSGEHMPPGGESWVTFETRVRKGLALLETVPGRVLLVTHSGVIRAILRMLFDTPMGKLSAVGHASISVVDLKPVAKVTRYDFRPGTTSEPAFD